MEHQHLIVESKTRSTGWCSGLTACRLFTVKILGVLGSNPFPVVDVGFGMLPQTSTNQVLYRIREFWHSLSLDRALQSSWRELTWAKRTSSRICRFGSGKLRTVWKEYNLVSRSCSTSSRGSELLWVYGIDFPCKRTKLYKSPSASYSITYLAIPFPFDQTIMASTGTCRSLWRVELAIGIAGYAEMKAAPLFDLTISRTGKQYFLDVVFLGSVIPRPNPHRVKTTCHFATE